MQHRKKRLKMGKTSVCSRQRKKVDGKKRNTETNLQIMYMLEDVFFVLACIISCNSQLELYLRGKKIVEKDQKRDSESRQQQ
jgi:hypothetical protein